jgi:hypothetical protein
MGECLTTEPQPQSSDEKMHHNLASTHSCLNTVNISTETVQEIKPFNQKLALRCVNPNIEIYVTLKKKQGNKAPSKVNNSTTKGWNNCKMDETSNNELNNDDKNEKEIKEDKYKHLNEFKENTNQ